MEVVVVVVVVVIVVVIVVVKMLVLVLAGVLPRRLQEQRSRPSHRQRWRLQKPSVWGSCPVAKLL
jgi:hypothetical protein